jgi:hypothetical protein
MDPVVDPEVAPLHAVAARLQGSGALPPTSLTAIRQRARRLRRRRRAGSGLVLVAATGVGALAIVSRPGAGEGEQVRVGAPGPGGTVPPGSIPAGTRPPLTTLLTAEFTADVRAYLRPNATADQIDALQQVLEDDPRVLHVRFQDQHHAYEELHQLSRDTPEMLNGVTAEALSANFLVDVGGDPAVAQALLADLQDRAGVREVVGVHGTVNEDRPTVVVR